MTESPPAVWSSAANVHRESRGAPQFFGKMMDVYGGTLRVEIATIIADDDHGIVLTRESGTVDGEHVAWTGVHVYTFDSGRVTQFVNYGSAEYQRFWTDKHAAASRNPWSGVR